MSEALPPQTDIAELFSRDPLSHSDKDIDNLVSALRNARSQFNLGNAQAGSMKPRTPKQKQALSLAEKLNLDLDFKL